LTVLVERSNLEKIIVLHHDQKKDKIKNILQKMRRENKIKLSENRQWSLDEA